MSRSPFASVLPALLIALPLSAAEDYSQWAHSREMWTNTSPDGAYVTASVKRFPVLVRLDSAHFPFAEALGKGQDFRAAGMDGKPLPYQIERWDSTAAKAEIWVLADSVAGNGWNKAFKLLWGKADAADSSNAAAVFDTADGWAAVWHLGRADTLPRPNSVAGGNPATPMNYDGDEARPGIIGLSDSLDGAAQGDYLDLGTGYSDFRSGLTYSVWANAEEPSFWSRLLDMGNGEGMDNFVVQRHLTGEDLIWDQYNGTAGNTRVTARRAFQTDEWVHFTVTVANKVASIYRNGVLVASEIQKDTIASAVKTKCYIGKSNWPGNRYYMGRIDEPRLARKARGADWVKLEYANQRADQGLLSFTAPTGACTAAFAAPKDTTLPEGSSLELAGKADCADAYVWEVISGPAPRILDPEVKAIQMILPRAAKDYTLRYRFSARFGAVNASGETLVTVTEAIPEPVFTLTAGVNWNGRDSLLLAPKVSNLAAIKASRDSVLNYAWTIADVDIDTAWRDDGLLLLAAREGGTLKVGLCLDNGGPATCKAATVTVGAPLGLDAMRLKPGADRRAPAFDAGGRRLDGRPWRRALSVFGFYR